MMPAVKTNPYLESVREAYRGSALYRSIHEGVPIAGTVAAALPREPGCDDEAPESPGPALGIPLDPLEIEFADRMNP